MARYTEAVCRQCRREGTKLFIKGDKCYTDKCPFTKRGFVPGQHGHARPKKASEYGLQLREKQKVRRTYGVLEKQFRLSFAKADAQKGVTGTNLLVILERRFDNIVYRLGLAESRNQARQLVTHGHFTINGKKVNIPSYQVKAGDVVAVRENSRSSEIFKEISETRTQRTLPLWVETNPTELNGTVTRYPSREEIDTIVNEQLIVELYSR